jgi:hypothetical protein
MCIILLQHFGNYLIVPINTGLKMSPIHPHGKAGLGSYLCLFYFAKIVHQIFKHHFLAVLFELRIL